MMVEVYNRTRLVSETNTRRQMDLRGRGLGWSGVGQVKIQDKVY